MASERDPLPVEIAPYDNGDACGLVVGGDVDIAVVPKLEVRLDAAIRETVGAFVIDLSDVEFMDSSGLSVVLRARALLARDERALAVIAPDGPVRRLFEIAGVADLLVIFDSREALSAHLVPAGRGG